MATSTTRNYPRDFALQLRKIYGVANQEELFELNAPSDPFAKLMYYNDSERAYLFSGTVGYQEYFQIPTEQVLNIVESGGFVVDDSTLKGEYEPEFIPDDIPDSVRQRMFINGSGLNQIQTYKEVDNEDLFIPTSDYCLSKCLDRLEIKHPKLKKSEGVKTARNYLPVRIACVVKRREQISYKWKTKSEVPFLTLINQNKEIHKYGHNTKDLHFILVKKDLPFKKLQEKLTTSIKYKSVFEDEIENVKWLKNINFENTPRCSQSIPAYLDMCVTTHSCLIWQHF